ncbi:hypothetical protein [Microbacterium sp. P01]
MTISISILLLALHAIRMSWRGIRFVRGGYVFASMIGFVGICVFANPLSQSRFIALTAFGSVLLLLLQPRSTRAGFSFVAIALFAGVLIYPLANSFRYAGTELRDITASTFASADFDGFQQVVTTMSYVEEHGITWGIQGLSAALFFVPRSVWPAKAEPAGGTIAEFAGYSFTNLSLPIHAEMYLQFGLIGVVAGMAALGYISSRLDTAWLHAPMSKLAVFAPYMAVVMFGILRGPLGGQVPVYLPVLLLLAAGLRSTATSSPPTETWRPDALVKAAT